MINEDIVKIKIFQTKKVLLQSNFDTRLKLHIHLYIMGHPFSMSIIIHWLTCFLQFVLRLEIRNRVTFSEIFEYVLNEHQTQRLKKKKANFVCTATQISSFVQCQVSFRLLPSSLATFILIEKQGKNRFTKKKVEI